jgi:hypothetical protein
MTLKEIDEQIIKTEKLGEKVAKYLEMYIGNKMYKEIALAIEFGYQLAKEESHEN